MPDPTPTPEPAAPAPAPEAPSTAPSAVDVLYPAAAPEPAAAAPEVDPAAAPAEPEPEPAADPPADPAAPPSIEITLPENVTLDEPLLAEFKSLAAEAKLDSPSAQKLVDLYAKALTAQQTAAQNAFTETQNQWLTEIKTFDEFKTEAATKQSLQSIGRLIDEFGSPEVREAMDITGAGNNPAIVRMLLNLAKLHSEGGPASPPRPAVPNKPRSLGEALYPPKPN